MTPVISVDVEDWQQSTWDRSLPISQRAEDNTYRMLDVLAEHDVRTTMFVLGKFAAAFPDAVRRIQAAGHEVACHGHGHVEIFKQSREEFAADVRRSKDLLEDIIGAPLLGYRAPDFSVVPRTLWALDVLAELGFEYDSSIFPIRHGRYGIVGWPHYPVNVRLASGREIRELPIATLGLLGRRVPVGGGGYHRLLPGVVARLAARAVMKDTLFVYYCHPYELDARELWDTDLPLSMKVRLHQGLGRGRFQHRLEEFIRRFGGQSARDALTQVATPDIQAADFGPA